MITLDRKPSDIYRDCLIFSYRRKIIKDKTLLINTAP
jgi:hypothetical protein